MVRSRADQQLTRNTFLRTLVRAQARILDHSLTLLNSAVFLGILSVKAESIDTHNSTLVVACTCLRLVGTLRIGFLVRPAAVAIGLLVTTKFATSLRVSLAPLLSALVSGRVGGQLQCEHLGLNLAFIDRERLSRLAFMHSIAAIGRTIDDFVAYRVGFAVVGGQPIALGLVRLVLFQNWWQNLCIDKIAHAVASFSLDEGHLGTLVLATVLNVVTLLNIAAIVVAELLELIDLLTIGVGVVISRRQWVLFCLGCQFPFLLVFWVLVFLFDYVDTRQILV